MMLYWPAIVAAVLNISDFFKKNFMIIQPKNMMIYCPAAVAAVMKHMVLCCLLTTQTILFQFYEELRPKKGLKQFATKILEYKW